MKPKYDFDKIKFATDSSTFERAVKLYEEGKITQFKAELGGFSAMVAVAIRATTAGKPLSDEDKQLVKEPVCSGRLGTLSKEELLATKLAISAAMRYVKPYNGPSRIWFAYQDSLTEGCNRLTKIVSDLSVTEQTAKLLVTLLLRLDKKLSVGGVDDSDGSTVGGFIEGVVNVLEEYAKLNPTCVSVFQTLKNRETCFGWEEPLVKIHQRQKS